LIFVTLPDITVLNWKDDKSVWVILKKWLWKKSLSLSEALSLGHVLRRHWSTIIGNGSWVGWYLAGKSTSLAIVLVNEAFG